MTAPATKEVALLAGIAVVECVDEAAGRYCGRLLAALGADVLRVGEPPTDPFGRWLDQGKHHVANLEAALATHAPVPAPLQVVIIGQTAREVEQIDFVLDDLKQDALRAAITWFGREGPYRDWRGDDALVHALDGVAAAFGRPDGPPTLPQGVGAQITAGVTLFVGTLAAMWHRRNGGATSRVEVNVFEAALCFSETAPARFEQNPALVSSRTVNRFSTNHPMTAYPTLDGWIGVTALTPAQWSALAELVGRPEWASDERFTTSQARVAHADLIDLVLTERFATLPTEHWLINGQSRRIPLAPIPTPLEVLATEHWRQRQSFSPLQAVPHVLAPGLPFRFHSNGQAGSPRPAAGQQPLSGIRVADFSMGWAGPLCTRLLGDLGADVVKVESLSHHDWWRGWEPTVTEPPATELSMLFNVMNRNKRGICLDLTNAEDLATALRLIATSDIAVDNHAPGVMDKLGLAPSNLWAVRADLTVVSMGTFGAQGPWASFRAYGSTVEQASGMPHVNGEDTWPPSLQHFALGDPVAGLFAAAAALAGLHGRRARGGTWFDLAQVECLFQLGADALIQAQIDGDAPRTGSRSATMAPRCVVAAADGRYVALVCRTEAQWHALTHWLGRPEWALDEALDSPTGRNRQATMIEAVIASAAASTPANDLASSLQAAGVPAAPVVTGSELTIDRHLRSVGTWIHVNRRYVGSHVMQTPVFRIDGERLPVRCVAPTLGEYTDLVRKELQPVAAPAQSA